MAEEPPTAPASLPKYLADGLPKQDDATLYETRAYIDELLNHHAEAESEIPDEADVVETNDDNNTSGTIVKEMVKCGKDSCRCNDGELHGPYLYHYWSESGTTKSEYVGTPD